jgi:protein-S-isoprenylcysteine O-methyltransferase Ste14
MLHKTFAWPHEAVVRLSTNERWYGILTIGVQSASSVVILMHCAGAGLSVRCVEELVLFLMLTVMHTALHLMGVLCVIFCTRVLNAPKEERYISQYCQWFGMLWGNSDSLTKGLAKKFPALLKIYVFLLFFSPYHSSAPLLKISVFSSLFLLLPCLLLLQLFSKFQLLLVSQEDRTNSAQDKISPLCWSLQDFSFSSLLNFCVLFLFFLGLVSFWFPCAICMFLLLLVV